MIIHEVIDKALRDPIFAAELQLQALKAQNAGRNTDEWEALMKNFARSRNELQVLRTLTDPDHPKCTDTTMTTITTTSSVVCMITMTTTTTTFFCDEHEKPGKGKAKKSGKKKA